MTRDQKLRTLLKERLSFSLPPSLLSRRQRVSAIYILLASSELFALRERDARLMIVPAFGSVEKPDRLIHGVETDFSNGSATQQCIESPSGLAV